MLLFAKQALWFSVCASWLSLSRDQFDTYFSGNNKTILTLSDHTLMDQGCFSNLLADQLVEANNLVSPEALMTRIDGE